MKKDTIYIMLYIFLLATICYLYIKLEENNDKSDILELKSRVSQLVTNDSLNTIKLQARIFASDSIINQLKERNKINENEIKRLKKVITIYDYTSNELPEY